jgi:hypothetical protein
VSSNFLYLFWIGCQSLSFIFLDNDQIILQVKSEFLLRLCVPIEGVKVTPVGEVVESTAVFILFYNFPPRGEENLIQ